MNKLQQLLDEKWPINGLPVGSYNHHHAMREAFTEGYNAGEKAAHEFFNDHMRLMEYMRNEANK